MRVREKEFHFYMIGNCSWISYENTGSIENANNAYLIYSELEMTFVGENVDSIKQGKRQQDKTSENFHDRFRS
ncbi:MAG: hypothetical protein N2235_11810 [Fischerella sp.]|nr:hypothetical protein [Fischerella sp.]